MTAEAVALNRQESQWTEDDRSRETEYHFNAETHQAFDEGDQMLREGTRQRFEGSAQSFISMLLEDENDALGEDESSAETEYHFNADTLEAIAELENGGGTLFEGSMEELRRQLLED